MHSAPRHKASLTFRVQTVPIDHFDRGGVFVIQKVTILDFAVGRRAGQVVEVGSSTGLTPAQAPSALILHPSRCTAKG